jgi:hypothetical protein
MKRIKEDIEIEKKAEEIIKTSKDQEELRRISEKVKEIECIQYSEGNASKLETLLSELKGMVIPKEEAQIFFIKNGGLTLILRVLDVAAAVNLL